MILDLSSIRIDSAPTIRSVNEDAINREGIARPVIEQS